MTRILVVGYDPDYVDFTDPGLPVGLSAEKVHQAVENGMRGLQDRGWKAEHCSIRPDNSAIPQVEQQLLQGSYDLVIVGAGVRLASQHLEVFEGVINVIHKHAPGAHIAFNAGLDDLPEAASRWISG